MKTKFQVKDEDEFVAKWDDYIICGLKHLKITTGRGIILEIPGTVNVKEVLRWL